MTDTAVNSQAFEIIDDCAARLLALKSPIPQAWKTRLIKAIKTPPKRRGRQLNIEKHTMIVRDLALVGPKLRQERTKHHNPGNYLDDIAKHHGVSRRTVKRIENDRPHYIHELQKLNEADNERKQIYIDGISLAICERLGKSDKKE